MSTRMSAGIYIIDAMAGAMARPVVIRRLPSLVPPTNINDNTPIDILTLYPSKMVINKPLQ